ncbi:phosphate metabolism protein 7 [Pseudogymnoascus australis]
MDGLFRRADPAPTDSDKDTSVSGLVATLVPTLVVALIYVSIFLILRRSHRRFYAPRTYLGTLRDNERSPELPSGMFNWFGTFWKIPDTYVLQTQSLDSYLFLRYMRILVAICFFGCIITWPVLFSVNATGGNGAQGLNMLAFGNLNKNTDGKNRMYAHVFIGWIFFGFVQLMVCRESIFYINLRQAFLLSPVYANRISSRTVLFTSVPNIYLEEAKLRKVFGDEVQHVWITRDTEALDKLVEERDKTAFRLEGAETKLIKLANKERLKALKKGAANDEEPVIATADSESGSIAARWLPAKKRPTHRTGLLGLFGSKVDSINWCREKLEKLIPDTEVAREAYKAGADKPVNAVFIEFRTQSAAQSAYQSLSHHQALHMSPRYIGMHPNEIVWSSLRISWWQKVVRRYAVQAFIAALIIFWAIPVAAVGLISNVPQLATLSWLTWLNDIPDVIMGVVSGLLPSVMLSILMSLVPIIMRILAKASGEPTLARVELFTQNAYFAFQVIQVFLVVTIGSAASSVAKKIADNPSSAASLLAEKIPLASNFYISYFILQGLTIASGVVSQVVGFFIFGLLYKYLTSTPRSMYAKWTTLSALSWGSILPVYSNIAVIAITYSLIAPLVLGFATVGITLFYLAYRYNILFVTDNTIDTKGLIYPRALQHLLTGVYLAEVCMIGLFGISAAIGPIILMVVALVGTVLFHIAMNSALDPLLYNLPKSLEAEEEVLALESGDYNNGTTAAAGTSNGEKSLEAAGAPAASAASADPALLASEATGEKTISTLPAAPHPKPNLLTKFLKPHIYADYATLRRLVPQDRSGATTTYSPEVERNAYMPPSVRSETPLLWIPRDEMGISRQEIAHTAKVIPITDEGAALDEKGAVYWVAEKEEGARPPIWEEKTYY